jgi:hypothetical protein
MELNAPISILNRQKFAEGSKLAPYRDDRNTPSAWKKTQAISRQGNASLDAIQQIVRKLSRDRRKPLGGFVPQTFDYEAIQPFQFYNTTPVGTFAINTPGTNYADGDTLTLSGGTLAAGSSATTFTINPDCTSGLGAVLALSVVNSGTYTTPPTYPAAVSGGSGSGLTVTAISTTDMPKCYSMRSGIIGLRSRFFPIYNDSADAAQTAYFLAGFLNHQEQPVGNYQQLNFIPGDFQASFDQPDPTEGNLGRGVSPLMLGAIGTKVLLNGTEEVQGDTLIFSQFMLNPAVNLNPLCAAFWLEIVDSLTSKSPCIHANLWGMMYDDATGVNPFPTSVGTVPNVNIIPLATVALATTGNIITIEQFLTGNLINLYDGYFNNTIDSGVTNGLAVGAKMCFRGDWTNDSLSGQYFYPGDVVRDVPPSGTTGGLTSTLYVCLRYLEAWTTSPGSNSTFWTPLVY